MKCAPSIGGAYFNNKNLLNEHAQVQEVKKAAKKKVKKRRTPSPCINWSIREAQPLTNVRSDEKAALPLTRGQELSCRPEAVRKLPADLTFARREDDLI
ncbi:hypothetical protein CL634_11190 [bacterium]|nr:hypothetical protein [bacterium]|tara:strand:+ start:1708 stop:2004 length:297 start_codon:yes stop_codon:yes gene_type:complete